MDRHSDRHRDPTEPGARRAGRSERGDPFEREPKDPRRADRGARESSDPDEEPLVRIAARRALRQARREALTPQFGRLLQFQATGAAGDALLALALAGTLFFSVPEADARGRVALYLALTVAPFAVISPLLARVLDRHRSSLRWAMVASALGRALIAWMLATRLETLYLFPLAFGMLLLSRAALIVRGAVLPALVPPGEGLVRANSSLSRTSAVAGIIAGIPGIALMRWPGPVTTLTVGAVIYIIGTLPALRIPSLRGRRAEDERLDAIGRARALPIRQALFAIGGMRLLVGFLIFHLAFSLRRADFGTVGLGLLVGSAVAGALVGAIVAPRLRKELKEEGILVVALLSASLVSFGVARWFGPITAGVLAFWFGVASGAAKVAFDAVVQRETPEGGRGWAFARFESILQLAWVLGALVPLLIAIAPGPGVVAVGATALAIALIYLAARHRSGAGFLRA